jgi:hypothetical protein
MILKVDLKAQVHVMKTEILSVENMNRIFDRIGGDVDWVKRFSGIS